MLNSQESSTPNLMFFRRYVGQKDWTPGLSAGERQTLPISIADNTVREKDTACNNAYIVP